MNDKEFLEKSILKIGEFNRFGSVPGLERVSELLRRLDNPHKQLKVIHVGGTNGKGSVCRYVYSVLQEAGYKTGLFISPYIEDFTERIEFDARQIAPQKLYEITEKVTQKAAEMVSEGLDSPTEFEVLTAIAFCYFKDMDTDFVVLEVGLGGRGDSTNVVEKPLVSCITSISMDHMDFLGNTLQMIAWEKSGIIKDKAPVVFYSEDESVTKEILSHSNKSNSPAYNCALYSPEISSINLNSTEFFVDIDEEHFEGIRVCMPGRHQVNNALCVLKIVQLLRSTYGYEISEEALKKGMLSARQPGRIEIISDEPLVVLDGSHNEDSIKALAKWVKEFLKPEDKILVVTGILKDKEYEKIANLLSEIGSDFIVTEPDNPRKLDALKYKEVLEGYIGKSQSVTVIKSIDEAILYSTEKALIKNDSIYKYKALLFTGSLYMIGVVRRKLKGILMEV